MFVGHYGISFGAKRAAPDVPLWVTFVAVQLLDIIWAPLVIFGIVMIAVQAVLFFGPPPPSDKAAAATALAAYAVFAAAAAWLERRRGATTDQSAPQ